MRLGYPNLELLEYKAREALMKNPNFCGRHNVKEWHFDFEADVFPQVWGSTALGFGGWGGQAITKAYTTVMHEIGSDFFCVFFDCGLAYTVFDAKAEFFEDLKNRNLESVGSAMRRY